MIEKFQSNPLKEIWDVQTTVQYVENVKSHVLCTVIVTISHNHS